MFLADDVVQKLAAETVVDFSGLGAEPTEDGGVSFNVGSSNGAALPSGAKYLAHIVYVAENASKPHLVYDSLKILMIFSNTIYYRKR